MEKPINMSVKDFLIRRMAVKMRVEEEVIHAVVAHQFKSASKALQKHCTAELSGLGTFHFNYKKADKRIEKLLSKVRLFMNMMENETLPEEKRRSARVTVTNSMVQLQHLKPRMNEKFLTDFRGLEEQFAASQGMETTDFGSEQGAALDMREMHLPLRGEETEAELQDVAS